MSREASSHPRAELGLACDSEIDVIQLPAGVAGMRVVARGHDRKYFRPSGRGDEDVRQIRTPKDQRGGLFGGDRNPSLHCSIGIITDHATAVPMGRPDESLRVDRNAVRETFLRGHLNQNAPVIDEQLAKAGYRLAAMLNSIL